MQITLPTLAIGASLLLLLGFLLGCAYYSWERHYRFKRRGSSEVEVPVRMRGAAPPQFEFVGLQAINDLLVKGGRVVSVKEGAVMMRETGSEGDNVIMQWTGFAVKFDVRL